MSDDVLDIPPAWERLNPAELRGTLMVIGASNTGKSTFARWLYRRLCREPDRRAAFLDGDPGQSVLGPPTTMTLALGQPGDDAWPPSGLTWRRFVQFISPRGHMLPLLVSAARLAQTAQAALADALVYDTTGFVSLADGGMNLKYNKIELLRPAVVFALQRERELDALVAPLKRGTLTRVIELRASRAAQERDVPVRQAHRAAQFARYLHAARTHAINWDRLSVLPAPRFVFNQIVSLEDADGFTLGLGIVLRADFKTRQVELQTPCTALDQVKGLRLGDATLDPRTFRDQPLA